MGLPGGPRRPNTTVYFVALAGILVLLALLCCYFIYFCVSKVKELTREDSPLQQAASSGPPRVSYPVQPVVRESATAMAKLCRQLPAKGDTVFPATSPAATNADTGSGDTEATTLELPEHLEKLPEHSENLPEAQERLPEHQEKLPGHKEKLPVAGAVECVENIAAAS